MSYENIGLIKPVVSVIIPIHNRFLIADRAIDSVFRQNYRPIELIIVDDFSDELYIPKVRSDKGFNVIFLRHEENKGPGTSRETGRQATTGDYIAYLDSDDLWHPEKLQKQVAMLKAYPEAGMCYCQSLEFDIFPLTGNEKLRYFSDREYNKFLPITLYTRPWSTCACLWTRNAMEKIGPWGNCWHFEDVDYDIRAGIQDISICYINEPLCFIRISQSPNRLSNQKKNQIIIQRINAYKEITKNLIKSGKLDNDEIRYFLERRLFKLAFEALDCPDKVYTSDLFYSLLDVVKPLYKKIAIYLYTLIYRIAPLEISVRLKYYLRKVIFKEYQNFSFLL